MKVLGRTAPASGRWTDRKEGPGERLGVAEGGGEPDAGDDLAEDGELIRQRIARSVGSSSPYSAEARARAAASWRPGCGAKGSGRSSQRGSPARATRWRCMGVSWTASRRALAWSDSRGACGVRRGRGRLGITRPPDRASRFGWVGDAVLVTRHPWTGWWDHRPEGGLTTALRFFVLAAERGRSSVRGHVSYCRLSGTRSCRRASRTRE